MTPAWDIIGLIMAVIGLIGTLSAVWYAYDQNKEKEAQNKRLIDLYKDSHHSPIMPQSWSSISQSMSISPSATFSVSPSIESDEEEEWTGSSGTTFVKTAEEIFTGISGTHLMKIPGKDEKCQWCGHRYPIILNDVEIYYCPKCGGPRK